MSAILRYQSKGSCILRDYDIFRRWLHVVSLLPELMVPIMLHHRDGLFFKVFPQIFCLVSYKIGQRK